MALTDSLRILITANGAQAEREFSKVGAAARTNLGHAETSAQRFGRSLTSAGVAMAAFGGVALVGLYKAAQAAQEEDLAIAKLNNSLANSPELAGSTSDAFLELAAQMQDVTTFTDDAVISAEAMLGTFHLTQDEILGLTPLVADLASKFDIDLNRAAILVGKAMDGNAGALGRMGVRIDETAFATDRFGAVMSALRENAGGFAEEEGATFNGQIEIMKNNLGDIAEGVGRGAVTAFNDMLGPVLSLSDAFQEMSPATQSTIGRVATFGSAGLIAAGSVSFLAGQVLTATERFNALKTAMSGANITAIAGKAPWVLLGLAIAAAANKWNLMEEEISGVEDSLDGAALAGMSASEMFTTLADDAGFVAVQMEEAERMAAQLAAVDPGSLREFAQFLSESGYSAQDVAQVLTGSALPAMLEATGLIGEVGPASEAAAGGLDGLGNSADEVAGQFDALNARIDAYLGTALGVEDAQVGLEASLDSLRESLAANGRTWDINTEAGRNNVAAGNDIVRNVGEVITAVMNEAEATGRYTGAQRTANGAMQNAIGELRRMRDSGRLSAEQYQILRDRILGIPHGVPGADAIITDLQRIYQEAINAASAVGQISGSLGGGGSYSGGGSSSATPSGGLRGGRSRGGTESVEEFARAVGRELRKGVPVVVMS